MKKLIIVMLLLGACSATKKVDPSGVQILTGVYEKWYVDPTTVCFGNFKFNKPLTINKNWRKVKPKEERKTMPTKLCFVDTVEEVVGCRNVEIIGKEICGPKRDAK